MIEGIGTVALQFHFWEFMFRIFGIISLQCRIVVKKIGFELLKKNNCYVDKISPQKQAKRRVKSVIFKGEFLDFSYFCVSYSTLLHLPPHRFHGVGGCWDRTP